MGGSAFLRPEIGLLFDVKKIWFGSIKLHYALEMENNT